MVSSIVGILQLVNFVALVVLFTNLNPSDITGVVQKLFNIYWILLICSLIVGIISGIGWITGAFETGLIILLKGIKVVILSVISIKLYPNLKKIGKKAKVSYTVMITTLIAYLAIIIVLIIKHG